jgi:acetolactate synthase regulatory subunit
MPIKNYTSQVDHETTAARIEQILVNFKASNILKEYQDGLIVALAFQVKDNGAAISIRLPVNVEGAFRVLKKQLKKTDVRTVDKCREQAKRTAWKLMQDWVETQLSLIEMGQAETLQVFLPYIWNGQKTFYTLTREKNLLALPAPRQDGAA